MSEGIVEAEASRLPPELYAYLFDTRSIWNSFAKKHGPKEERIVLTNDSRNAISNAGIDASLISSEEAARILKFYFHRDAKLSLGSALLKRVFVVNALYEDRRKDRRHYESNDGEYGSPSMRGRTTATFSVNEKGEMITSYMPPAPPWLYHGQPPPPASLKRWWAIRFGRGGGIGSTGTYRENERGKPCYRPLAAESPDNNTIQLGDDMDLDFNVTHQAGLVLLAGLHSKTADQYRVGIDVTCVAERHERDVASIRKDGCGNENIGYDKFVRMHEEVFSEADLWSILQEGSASGLKGRLRRFYAFWALKEAYVKMEGEALLADWLRDIEFRGVSVPEPARFGEQFDEPVLGILVFVNGRQRENVQVFLQAFEDDYLVATAVCREAGAVEVAAPKFREVDMDEVWRIAEGREYGHGT